MTTKKLVLKPRHGEMINPALTPDYLGQMLAALGLQVNFTYVDTHGACVALANGLEVTLQKFDDGKRGTLVAFITRDGFSDGIGTSEEDSLNPDGVPNKEIKAAVMYISLVPRNPQRPPYN